MVMLPCRRRFAFAAAVISFVCTAWTLTSPPFTPLGSMSGTRNLQNDEGNSSLPLLEISMRRNHTGTWIGNSWVPPSGWRLFSAAEMLQLYHNKSMLWVGDSTTRRCALTLYGILQSPSDAIPKSQIDSASVIDVNKGVVTEPCYRYGNNTEIPITHCRLMPKLSGDSSSTNDTLFTIYKSPCLANLESFLLQELAPSTTMAVTTDYNLLIIGQGIWEAVRKSDCIRIAGNRSMEEVYGATFDLLEQLSDQRPDLLIVWRTSGFHQDGLNSDVVHYLNEYAMLRIEEWAKRLMQQGRTTNFVYVNFGKTIESRSFGNDRIRGDMKPHYGLEARYSLLQMLANVVFEADRWSRAFRESRRNIGFAISG